MAPKRNQFMLPGGLRGVAIIIGLTVVLSVTLHQAKAHSATAGARAELIFSGIAELCAIVILAYAIRRYRECRSSHWADVAAARSKLYFAAAFVLTFAWRLVRTLTPQWETSTAGQASDWILGLVALLLLLLATQPRRPPASGRAS